MQSTEQIREAVKAHALAHYEEGGWDFVVEAYEDRELDEAIRNAGWKTGAQAIKGMADVVAVLDDRRAGAGSW